jgi:hypothetical protein
MGPVIADWLSFLVTFSSSGFGKPIDAELVVSVPHLLSSPQLQSAKRNLTVDAARAVRMRFDHPVIMGDENG